MACTLDAVGAVFTHTTDWDKRKSTLDKIGGFFTGRVFTFFDGVKGRDKAVKAINSFAYLAEQISVRTNGANHKTTLEAHRVTLVTSTARDVFGLFNVLGGCLASVYSAAMNLFSLFTSNKDVYLSGAPEADKKPQTKQDFNKITVDRPFQRCLAIIQELGRLTGAVTYSIAFGLCRPIRFAGKMIGELSASAKKVVAAFATIMFVNHVAGILENGAGLWRKTLRLNQIAASGFDGSDVAYARAYAKEVTGHGLGLLEKGFELVCDATKVFHAPMGTLPLAILGAGIGLIGLLKVWVGGYEAPKI